MSKLLNIPLVTVNVRRDAFTITPTTVPPYEVTMLRTLFGKENVTEQGKAGTRELDAEAEHERLSNKYGVDKVIRVFGDDEGARLLELIEREAVKKEKPAAEEAATKTTAGGSKAKAAAAKPAAEEAASTTDQAAA